MAHCGGNDARSFQAIVDTRSGYQVINAPGPDNSIPVQLWAGVNIIIMNT